MAILKLKIDTLCKDYENGGLKNVDITFDIKLTMLVG